MIAVAIAAGLARGKLANRIIDRMEAKMRELVAVDSIGKRAVLTRCT